MPTKATENDSVGYVASVRFLIFVFMILLSAYPDLSKFLRKVGSTLLLWKRSQSQ